jgi:hypothetical protein
MLRRRWRMTVHVWRIGVCHRRFSSASAAAQRRPFTFDGRHTAAVATAADALVDDEAGADILVDGITDDLVLALEVVDAVLLVGEAAAALAAHEGVLLPALVLEVAVQVVVPVIGPLKKINSVSMILITV